MSILNDTFTLMKHMRYDRCHFFWGFWHVQFLSEPNVQGRYILNHIFFHIIDIRITHFHHHLSKCSTLVLYNNSVSKNIISKILSKLEKLQRLQKLASNHFLRSILGLWSFKRWYFKLLSYLKYSKKYFFPTIFFGFLSTSVDDKWISTA